jgi:protein SCO1/2
VFITIDPERDTPELLKAYITNFDPSFVALRGTLGADEGGREGLQGLLRQGAGKSADSYTMDHTAGATSSTRPGQGCGCSSATAAAPRRWRPT